MTEIVHPLNELVVKVAARCNIDCDYCYEFNLGDDSWRRAAKIMSPETSELLAGRIQEHAQKHGLDRMHIGLHGGEPLLLGAKGLDNLARTLRKPTEGRYEIDITLQTNAILLTPEIAAVIKEHNIAVGISIDGNRAANDRHRVDHRGRSTFLATVAGLDVLRQHAPRQLSGLLAVIDVRNDPIEVLDALGELNVPYVDFLLPHQTWDRPPMRQLGNPVEYANWYFSMYQAWVGGRQKHLRIRFLEHLIRQIAGGGGLYEQNTLEAVTLAVVNTDGGYEAVDAIKATASGMQNLGLTVRDNSLDDVLSHPLVAMRQRGMFGLSATCRACSRVEVCGGGYFPHRFRSDNGFDNPSVYCSDLFDLIGRLESDLASRVKRSA